MDAGKNGFRELAKYALAKKGARQSLSWIHFDPIKDPHIELPGTGWGQFYDVKERDGKSFAHMPVLEEDWKRLSKAYPALVKTDWGERDGHTYMYVPLGGEIPFATIREWIDSAHALVWKKLDKEDVLKIELAGLPYDEPKLLDRLIEMHELADHRKVIRKLPKPALLLRTLKGNEAKIPLGASKIGGKPDLPAKAAWPTYKDGKPLAFLAQLNLKEIAKADSPIKGVPTEGLLSLFSAWGWMGDGDLDPHTPQSDVEQEEDGWTVVLHTPRRAKLERRKAPRGVHSFKAAAVEPVPILSVPNHRDEPTVSKLGLDEAIWSKIDSAFSDFRSIQMGHYLKNSDSLASHHLLGGYALFQQSFPREVLSKGLAMFLQLGTDAKTEMHWGDGGELTFYADAKALAKGRFERLWGEYQGG